MPHAQNKFMKLTDCLQLGPGLFSIFPLAAKSASGSIITQILYNLNLEHACLKMEQNHFTTC